MKVTIGDTASNEVPNFTPAQVEYLRRVYPNSIKWDAEYTLETVHRIQGQAQVIHHIASLVARQSK